MKSQIFMVPSGSIVFQDLLTQSFVFFSSLSPDDVCEPLNFPLAPSSGRHFSVSSTSGLLLLLLFRMEQDHARSVTWFQTLSSNFSKSFF